jgi:hypothetical protein
MVVREKYKTKGRGRSNLLSFFDKSSNESRQSASGCGTLLPDRESALLLRYYSPRTMGKHRCSAHVECIKCGLNGSLSRPVYPEYHITELQHLIELDDILLLLAGSSRGGLGGLVSPGLDGELLGRVGGTGSNLGDGGSTSDGGLSSVSTADATIGSLSKAKVETCYRRSMMSPTST